ncbi:MAG: hypothetical protein J5662_05635 [Clostridia bacterium]|nr:hypothetical protein [Clostridia bacterium]
MQKLNVFTMYASKVIEIFFFVVLGLLVLCLIASCFAVGWANRVIKENNIDVFEEIGQIVEQESDIDLGDTLKLGDIGLKGAKILREDGTINPITIILYFIYGMFSCTAFAMIFRNIYLILKTAKGETWFAQGETPFQKNITRMIREIGIFLLILAAAEFVIGLFVPSVNVTLVYIVIGILMLCLSSFFSYGEQLQQENDGLI